MSSSHVIAEILWRYKKREELSAEELDELKSWLRESPKHEQLFDELSNTSKWDLEIEKWEKKYPDATRDRIQKRIAEMTPGVFESKKKTDWKRYTLAAATTLLVLSSIFWWLGKKQTQGS